jgi:hypothetical protein
VVVPLTRKDWKQQSSGAARTTARVMTSRNNACIILIESMGRAVIQTRSYAVYSAVYLVLRIGTPQHDMAPGQTFLNVWTISI